MRRKVSYGRDDEHYEDMGPYKWAPELNNRQADGVGCFVNHRLKSYSGPYIDRKAIRDDNS